MSGRQCPSRRPTPTRGRCSAIPFDAPPPVTPFGHFASLLSVCLRRIIASVCLALSGSLRSVPGVIKSGIKPESVKQRRLSRQVGIVRDFSRHRARRWGIVRFAESRRPCGSGTALLAKLRRLKSRTTFASDARPSSVLAHPLLITPVALRASQTALKSRATCGKHASLCAFVPSLLIALRRFSLGRTLNNT